MVAIIFQLAYAVERIGVVSVPNGKQRVDPDLQNHSNNFKLIRGGCVVEKPAVRAVLLPVSFKFFFFVLLAVVCIGAGSGYLSARRFVAASAQ